MTLQMQQAVTTCTLTIDLTFENFLPVGAGARTAGAGRKSAVRCVLQCVADSCRVSQCVVLCCSVL